MQRIAYSLSLSLSLSSACFATFVVVFVRYRALHSLNHLFVLWPLLPFFRMSGWIALKIVTFFLLIRPSNLTAVPPSQADELLPNSFLVLLLFVQRLSFFLSFFTFPRSLSSFLIRFNLWTRFACHTAQPLASDLFTLKAIQETIILATAMLPLPWTSTTSSWLYTHTHTHTHTHTFSHKKRIPFLLFLAILVMKALPLSFHACSGSEFHLYDFPFGCVIHFNKIN